MATQGVTSEATSTPDTVFETEAWGRFMEKRYGYVFEPLRVTLASGQAVCIPASRLERRFGRWGVYRSTPPDLFGNVLAQGALSLPLLVETFDELSRQPELHSLTIALHPLHPQAGVIQQLPERYVLSWQGATRLLRLAQPFEHIWDQSFCKQHRRKIRAASRQGVHACLDNSDSAIEAYYPLYVESCQRLGLDRTEPIEFFYDLKAYLGGYYSLLLAQAGGQTVAGLILLTCQQKVFAYQISSAERYWDLFPNHLLFSTAIEQACAAGAVYIDFLPTGSHEGPETFKERFGAERLTYRIYRVNNRLYSAAVRLKDVLTVATPRPLGEPGA